MPTGFLVSLNVQVVSCGVSTFPGGELRHPPPPTPSSADCLNK